MKTMKNNKGIAMVTVLIGISFIIILASSMVYMSYMNFITKAVRYASTDNFYTDEFALDDLCMSLQQSVMGSSSVADAMAELRNVTGAVSGLHGGYVYNNDAVAGLIQVASQEATISVNTIVNTGEADNYIENGSSVRLVGVEITSTTEQGYMSTICTDIVISFPSGGLGDLDVNDFSVISDSPVRVEEGDAFFSGCVYISKGGGSTALTLDAGANMHILSPRGIINGDIQLGSNSLLAISGVVTVLGDVYLGSGATLLCGDEVQISGTIHEGSGRVLGSASENQDIDTSVIDALGSGGLTGQLFTDVYVRSTENDFQTFGLQDFVNNPAWAEVIESYPAPYDQVCYGIGTQNPINNLFGQKGNGLIMTPNDAYIKGNLNNSTVICGGSIVFQAASMNTYMTCMSDEMFEAAKTILLREARGLPGVNNVNWPTGLKDDDEMRELYDGASDNNRRKTETQIIENGALTTITRYFVFDDNKMYVPVGYLLVPDTSRVMTELFSGIQGDANPNNPILYIENWSKE